MDYRATLIKHYYSAFRHYNIDVIDTPHTLDGYEVVISPFLAYIDEDLKARVIQWIKGGGTWIVGPMSDIMDNNVSKYTNAPYSFLEELAGVYTKYQKPVANDVFKAYWRDGEECRISTCYDAYEYDEDMNVMSLARYDGDEFDGLSVITQRKVGKGKVILVGSVISHGDLLRLVDIPPIAEASENVILTERSGKEKLIIAVETEDKEGYIVLDGEYTELLTGKKLEGNMKISPYGVLVLIQTL